VALQAGSVHVLRVPLDKIWNNSAADGRLSLTPGRYRITARFEGRVRSS
jgi:hypothetical protein